MGEHARLSASGASRWMNCPGSVSLSDGIPSVSSSYAKEGTRAHELAEECLLAGLDPADLIDDRELADTLFVYTDYVRAIAKTNVVPDVEVKLTLDHIHKDMNIMTADFIHYDPKSKALDIVDYKHGAGVGVEVENNPQLKTYALAGLYKYEFAKTITVHIVQPRFFHADGPCRKVTYDITELLEWESLLKEAANRVDTDPSYATGKWCKWCPAAQICPLINEKVRKAAASDFSKELTENELAEAMDDVIILKAWISLIESTAYERVNNGQDIPGYKLVNKRAVRRWIDEDKVYDKLINVGLSTEEIYSSKIKTPAQIEKLLGKEHKDLISPDIKKESSGTVLVTLEDKRQPARDTATNDFKE